MLLGKKEKLLLVIVKVNQQYSNVVYVITQVNKGVMLLITKEYTGEKPHACSVPGCNYRASRKHHIVYHERVHSDAKPYSCDYKKENGEKCTYATKFKSDLNLHQRIHRGEKNFVCTFPACSYKASQRGNLIRCVFLFFYSIFPINFLFLSRFELFKYFLI
jgi:uncharacterized Zn-finger protein